MIQFLHSRPVSSSTLRDFTFGVIAKKYKDKLVGKKGARVCVCVYVCMLACVYLHVFVSMPVCTYVG